MKIVDMQASVMPVNPGLDGLIRHIEQCGRLCYKSEDSVSEDSGVKFVRKLIHNGHEAMLEHGSICIMMWESSMWWILRAINAMNQRGIPSYLTITNSPLLVSGNVRAWRDFFRKLPFCNLTCPEGMYNLFMEDYNVLFSDVLDNVVSEWHSNFGIVEVVSDGVLPPDSDAQRQYKTYHERLSVRFVVPRGVSHELVRHRRASFAQESTRYCNYSKGRFGRSITVIKPDWIVAGSAKEEAWLSTMQFCENCYFDMLFYGLSPQEARGVLPLDLKTEVIMTADPQEWVHFLDLRARGVTGAPHPQMRKVALIAADQLCERNMFIAGRMGKDK